MTVGSSEGPGIVGVMVTVATGRTEGIVVKNVAVWGGRVVGLLVGRSVGLDVGCLVGTRDGASVTLVGIAA